MDKRMVVAAALCTFLLSLANSAFGQIAPTDFTDFTATVPETASLAWLVGSAAAGLVGLRLYLGKKR